MIKASKIIVDADACPVKGEIAATAQAFRVDVIMAASYDHHLKPLNGVRIVQVDRSSQSVDLFIANHIQRGDILITQDFGLATLGLSKQAIVLSFRGEIYSDQTMDYLLAARHEAEKRRRSGRRSKGPKPFSDEDRYTFQQTLTKILLSLQENSPT